MKLKVSQGFCSGLWGFLEWLYRVEHKVRCVAKNNNKRDAAVALNTPGLTRSITVQSFGWSSIKVKRSVPVCLILSPHAERFNLHFLKSFSDRQKMSRIIKELWAKGEYRLEVQHQRAFWGEKRNCKGTFKMRKANFLNCGKLTVSFVLWYFQLKRTGLCQCLQYVCVWILNSCSAISTGWWCEMGVSVLTGPTELSGCKD